MFGLVSVLDVRLSNDLSVTRFHFLNSFYFFLLWYELLLFEFLLFSFVFLYKSPVILVNITNSFKRYKTNAIITSTISIAEKIVSLNHVDVVSCVAQLSFRFCLVLILLLNAADDVLFSFIEIMNMMRIRWHMHYVQNFTDFLFEAWTFICE